MVLSLAPACVRHHPVGVAPPPLTTPEPPTPTPTDVPTTPQCQHCRLCPANNQQATNPTLCHGTTDDAPQMRRPATAPPPKPCSNSNTMPVTCRCRRPADANASTNGPHSSEGYGTLLTHNRHPDNAALPMCHLDVDVPPTRQPMAPRHTTANPPQPTLLTPH